MPETATVQVSEPLIAFVGLPESDPAYWHPSVWKEIWEPLICPPVTGTTASAVEEFPKESVQIW